MKAYLQKYRELFLYIFFGGCTFLLDAGLFRILSFWLPLQENAVLLHICSVFSTFMAITFAYLTNRSFVFSVKASGKAAVMKEIVRFYAVRLLALILAELFLEITVIHLGLTDWVMKIAVNILVIVSNYLCSKFWIFKTNRRGEE